MSAQAHEPQAASRYPLRGETLVGVASVVIAEYEVLRGEIETYHDHQKQIMNFSFVILAAMFATLAAGLGSDRTADIETLAPIFLAFPPVYTLLACLFCDRMLRIVRLADYVHNYLRPAAQRLTGERLWEWETYKRSTQVVHRRLALVLDKARFLVFLLPGAVALALYLIFADDDLSGVYRVLGIIVAALSMFGTLAMMFVVEETSGVQQRIVAPGSSLLGNDAPRDAEALVEAIRRSDGRVVVAGGCFDVLHEGHMHLLEQARAQGDCLVVAVNSDDSVRELKGEERPVLPIEDRRAILESLRFVDAVVVFPESTAVNVLRQLRPDVFVKGGDYVDVPLAEQEVLAEWGGKLVTLPRVGGKSSTAIIAVLRTRLGG